MSPVDYASSSDEDGENREEEIQLPKQRPCSSNSTILKSGSGSRANQQQLENASNSSYLKLPDASLLLNSPTVVSSLLSAAAAGTDHTCRVALAMTETTASRKRDSNELPCLLPRPKLPKGLLLRNTKTVPDTGGGGMLVPPQLTGRSNIVTEDIGKLFVKKKPEPSVE